MQIVLLLLKIIGILLLVLLGLLVLALLAVLFVPVRYRLSGFRWPDKGTALHGRVSWLWPLLAVRFGYEKEAYFQLRILGIQLKRKEKEEHSPESSPPPAPRSAARSAAPPVSAQAAQPPSATVQPIPPSSVSEREPAREPLFQPEDKEDSGPGFFKRLWEGLRSFSERLRSFAESLREWKRKLQRLGRGIEEKKQRFGRFFAFLALPEVKETLRLCLRQVKGLLKHIGPRKIYLKGRFGFDDPSLTGQVTGALSMLPLAYREGVTVTPDFTQACLEGEFEVRGRIRLAKLLALGLKIWFDENFKKTYQKWKEM